MKHTQATFMITLGVSLSACHNSGPQRPPEIINARPVSPYHIVKKGETLADVASKHNMKEDELVRINSLKDPYTLFTGQRILVRVTPNNDFVNTSNPDGDVTIKKLDDDTQSATDDSTGIPLNAGGLANSAAAASGIGSATDVAGSAAGAALSSGTLDAASTGSTDKNDHANEHTTPHSDGITWPVEGKIITHFGQKMTDGKKSDGLRISAPVNTKVKAVEQAVVRDAGALVPGYGNMVILKHADGKLSIYAHLKEILVKAPKKGEKITISKGQAIGKVGQTGNASEPMLYFQIRNVDLKPLDPEKLLPSR
jgi:murein DD-endopeptidase MepM/ murein hydrolase activator NlpD